MNHDILFDFIAQYMPLEEAEKQAIIELDVFKWVEKGTILQREGDRSNQYFFVLKGCIRSYILKNGEEKTTGLYLETESFSPPCNVKGNVSDLFVETLEDSIVCIANPSMEKDLFSKFPRFESLCRILVEDLLAKNREQFDVFRISNPEERYLYMLEHQKDLVQRVPQHILASYLGIQPQSLSRIRKRLAEKS